MTRNEKFVQLSNYQTTYLKILCDQRGIPYLPDWDKYKLVLALLGEFSVSAEEVSEDAKWRGLDLKTVPFEQFPEDVKQDLILWAKKYDEDPLGYEEWVSETVKEYGEHIRWTCFPFVGHGFPNHKPRILSTMAMNRGFGPLDRSFMRCEIPV